MVSRNYVFPLCFHDRKAQLIIFSGLLLGLSVIQINCSPRVFTMISSEVIIYFGITELLLICLFQSDFLRCQLQSGYN